MKRESRDVWIYELMLSDIRPKPFKVKYCYKYSVCYFIFMYLLLFIISVYCFLLCKQLEMINKPFCLQR